MRCEIIFDRSIGNCKPRVFESEEEARAWIMDGMFSCEGAEQEHYVGLLKQLERYGRSTLYY